MLVDDHAIVLQGLQQLLDREKDFTVIAACANVESALEAFEREAPDLLVLDLRMPGADGFVMLRRLVASGRQCPTVLLTAAIDDHQVLDAVNLGVRGLVMKDSSPEILIDCIRRVHAGQQWLDQPTVTRALSTALHRVVAARETALTSREIEIVGMVSEGLRNRAIATRLSISEGTVKVHLHPRYEKLGVDGRLSLTLCAREKRLV
jgi:DNA-binding NarL/FixJ family response regulator